MTPGNPAQAGRPPATPRRRRRPRVSVSLAPETLRRLEERAAATGESLGREIDFAVREADADHSRLRHAVGNALNPVPFQCVEIRDATRQPEAIEAVGVIEGCMGRARELLSRPAGGTRA